MFICSCFGIVVDGWMWTTKNGIYNDGVAR